MNFYCVFQKYSVVFCFWIIFEVYNYIMSICHLNGKSCESTWNLFEFRRHFFFFIIININYYKNFFNKFYFNILAITRVTRIQIYDKIHLQICKYVYLTIKVWNKFKKKKKYFKCIFLKKNNCIEIFRVIRVFRVGNKRKKEKSDSYTSQYICQRGGTMLCYH